MGKISKYIATTIAISTGIGTALLAEPNLNDYYKQLLNANKTIVVTPTTIATIEKQLDHPNTIGDLPESESSNGIPRRDPGEYTFSGEGIYQTRTDIQAGNNVPETTLHGVGIYTSPTWDATANCTYVDVEKANAAVWDCIDHYYPNAPLGTLARDKRRALTRWATYEYGGNDATWETTMVDGVATLQVAIAPSIVDSRYYEGGYWKIFDSAHSGEAGVVSGPASTWPKMNIVVEDVAGHKKYIPIKCKDAKGHTWPCGFVQTHIGKGTTNIYFSNMSNFHKNPASMEDMPEIWETEKTIGGSYPAEQMSFIEVYRAGSSVSELCSNYKIKGILVYK